MLETVCPDCFVPIMRSRSGVELCVLCNDAYKNKEDKDVQKHLVNSSASLIKPQKDEFLPDEEEYAKMLKEYEETRGAPVVVASASSYLASK